MAASVQPPPGPGLVSEILDKAADIIETRGWWQGTYMMPGGNPANCPVCLLGAINVATGLAPNIEGAFREDGPASTAARALAEHMGLNNPNGDGLVDLLGNEWNDREAESPEQVIAELRAAAQAEREAGR